MIGKKKECFDIEYRPINLTPPEFVIRAPDKA